MRRRHAVMLVSFGGNLFSAQHNTRAVQRHELVREGSALRTRDHDFVTSDSPDFHPSDVLEDAKAIPVPPEMERRDITGTDEPPYVPLPE